MLEQGSHAENAAAFCFVSRKGVVRTRIVFGALSIGTKVVGFPKLTQRQPSAGGLIPAILKKQV